MTRATPVAPSASTTTTPRIQATTFNILRIGEMHSIPSIGEFSLSTVGLPPLLIQFSAMKSFSLALFAAILVVAAPSDQKGVEYGKPGGHALLLDLHVPDGPGPFPAAILVHGGGFDAGSRATNMSPTFQPLADAGFAWFSIDYRMAPEFRFAEAREDMDAAIKWVKANATPTGSIRRRS